jgi:hypothetical protein
MRKNNLALAVGQWRNIDRMSAPFAMQIGIR